MSAGWRTVAAASPPASPLVLCYLVGAQCDADLRAALPGCEIWARDDAPLQPAAPPPGRDVVLIGFSAGCQPVRAHLLAGLCPVAVVTLDGTHASSPPAEWQIAVWRLLASEARRGERLWVATCTQQLYVEHLPPGQRFAATRHVLEAAVGLQLPAGAEVSEGALHVLSYASAAIDAPAHIRQQREVMPDVLRRFVAPWLAARHPTDPAPPPSSAEREPLGVRVVRWYEREAAAGTREEPAGSNTSPRIRSFLAACRRRTGGPGADPLLGLTAGAWCAAAYCAACDECALPGEPYPAPRASGVEMVEDAKETDSWLDVAEVRAGGRHPELGDAAIFRRAGPGWARHVTAYAGGLELGAGVFTTWAGNEGDRIGRSTHRLDDPDLLGFYMLRRR